MGFKFQQNIQPYYVLHQEKQENVCSIRLTATAGTKISRNFSFKNHHFIKFLGLPTKSLQPHGSWLSQALRPLLKILHCWCPMALGPCFSSYATDHLLKPVTSQRLDKTQKSKRKKKHLLANTLSLNIFFSKNIWNSFIKRN